MKSKIFYSDQYEAIEERIKTFLNEQEAFLSGSTVNSPRAVGDAIQDILSDNLQGILGEQLCAKYSSEFARRAMADLAFEDCDGFYNVVDVKTHRLSTKFNMPNLISVERLARFYEDDRNYFVILMVSYDVDGLKAIIEQVKFVSIEFLGWGLLNNRRFGLGANSNRQFESCNDQFQIFA